MSIRLFLHVLRIVLWILYGLGLGRPKVTPAEPHEAWGER